MAVSSVSRFLSTQPPSNPPFPRPSCLLSLPSHLHLPRSSSGWTSLVAAVENKTRPSSFPSLNASDISHIVYPALAYSTTLYFKSAYNVQVIVSENEPEEKLLNRFRKEVLKAGVLQECKRRRFFEDKREKKKRKAREAAKRNRKRRPKLRAPAQNEHEKSKKEKDDEEDDNWDLPDVDLPYG